MPTARSGDPVRGVAPGWFHAPPTRRPSATASAVGLALVVGLLFVAGTLVTTGGGVLEHGGRLGVSVDASPSPEPTPAQARPTPRVIAPVTGSSASALPEVSPEEPSAFSCEDTEISDATKSRWQLRTVLAGARRRFDRVTLELARRGGAKRAGRVSVEWMSPQEARDTFGLPSFSGRKGILLTFPAQVSTSGAQLIGPTDLSGDGIDSMSGVYRFVDVDGGVRVFIAIRDRSCARIRSPGLADEGESARRASIIIDLAAP
jgi:hypothetical protein